MEEGRLHFERLTGTGPKTGWVSVKLGAKELLVRVDRRPRAEAKKPPPSPSQPRAQAPPRRRAQSPAARPRQPAGGGQQAPKAQQAPEVVPPSGDLVASMQYLEDDGVQPFIYMYPREDGGEQTHANFVHREVSIVDGRAGAASLTLDTHGVMLVPHHTALSTYDFYERPDKVWGQYYAEMRELIKRATGASRVAVFDHNIRNPREAKWRRGVVGYVPYAHNDYTVESAPMRVRDVAKPSSACAEEAARPGAAAPTDGGGFTAEEVEELLGRRYVIVNVWRNISEAPIAGDPLAVADGRSIRDSDYVPTDLIYRDRAGQTYSVTHDPSHRWLYFSGMRKDEAILLKCYDSKEDPETVRWTAHTGFMDPRTPPGAPARESIDARCIAFFEDRDVARTSLPAADLFPEGVFKDAKGLSSAAESPGSGLPASSLPSQ